MSTRNSKCEQRYLEMGVSAAKRGEPASKITEQCGPFNLVARNAWLVGWRNGGGNIMTGLVEKKP